MKKLLAALVLTAALSSSNAHAQMGFGMADTTNLSGGQSLSAIFGLDNAHVQAILGVHKTKGDFDFGIGGFFKMPIVGSMKSGMHFGPGATIGTFGGDFAFTILAGLGVHFTLFDNMLLSLDGGPMYVHTANAKNFRLKPTGEMLGLSIHYMWN